MNDEEFAEWWASLTPAEQDEIMYAVEMQSVNQVPGGFNLMPPQIEPGQYDLLGFGGGLPQEIDRYGNQLPWGMDQEAQATSLARNRNSMLIDNVTAAMSGPGAYDMNAFQDLVTMPTEVLDQPGFRTAQAYANASGGYESFLAQMMLAGMTPSQAVAEMWRFLDEPESESVDPQDVEMREALRASLPTNPDVASGMTPMSGTGAEGRESRVMFDEVSVNRFAQDLFRDLASDPDLNTGWTDPQSGITYKSGPETERSEAAQWYDQRGLPTPNESYEDLEYLQGLGFGIDEATARGRAEGKARAESNVDRSIANVNEMSGIEEQMKQLFAGRGQEASPRGLSDHPGAMRQMGQRQQLPFVNELGGTLRANAPQDQTIFNYLLGQRPGRPNDVQRTQQQTQQARRGRNKALQQQIAEKERVIPSEVRSAAALGRAAALQRSGRTPLGDALMQRLLGARAQGLYRR